MSSNRHITLPLVLGVVLIVSLAPWAVRPIGTGTVEAEVLVAGRTPPEMIYMPGGAFGMGFAQGYEDEKPVREVILRPFLIYRHEATNRQFAEFVQKTGYQTHAPQDGYAWCYIKGQSDFTTVVIDDLHTDHDTLMTESGSSFIPDPSQEGHALADQPLPTSGQATGVVLTEANVWQGIWPVDNRLIGRYFFYTSRVGCFALDTIAPGDMIEHHVIIVDL